MRIIVIILCIMSLPLAVAAQSVAVLPVSYTVYKKNASSPERALKVLDAVVEGIEAAGMTTVTGADVTKASETVEGGADCADSACAGAVAKAAGTDFAIFVSVVDKDGQFDIAIHISNAEPVTAQPFVIFKALLRRITGLVEAALKEESLKRAAAEPSGAEPGEAVSDPATEDVEETPGAEPSQKPSKDDKKKLPPVAFYASMGTTAALAIAYTAMESVGYAKYKDADAEGRRDLKPLQVANRAVLGCTLVAAVASTVIFFFTDFDSGSGGDVAADRKGVSVTPTAASKGGGVVLFGEF
jgi:hypothetical protein